MEFDITEVPIMLGLVIVVAAILINMAFGVARAAKLGEFDVKRLPQFLADHVLPYVGGLVLLAVAAEFLGEPFAYLYYPTVAAVLAKYAAEIKSKIQDIYFGG